MTISKNSDEQEVQYEYVYETVPVKKTKKKAAKKVKVVKKTVIVNSNNVVEPIEPVKKGGRKKFEFTTQEYNDADKLIDTVEGAYLNKMKNVNDYFHFSKLTQDYKIKYKKEFEDPKKLAVIAKHRGHKC